jgi:hypothetical protein
MMGCALGLIALAVGYFVLVQANKERGGLKTLGQVLGVVIMVAAIFSGFCAAKCKWDGKGMMCPFSGKMMTGAPAQP